MAEASSSHTNLTTLNLTHEYHIGLFGPIFSLGVLMHDAVSSSPRFRLAVAPGVPSAQLSKLLARQRVEEPCVALALFEVSGDILLQGLREGRFDAGMSLQAGSDLTLNTQALWSESMAVALPSRLPLLQRAKLTVADLLAHPIYRWQAEACPLLDERLSSPMPVGENNLQWVMSFEMMAMLAAGGYGVGLSARWRIEHGHGWGLTMRPLADGPYEIVTYLQRPHAQTNAVFERFERRALEVAKAGTAERRPGCPGPSRPGRS